MASIRYWRLLSLLLVLTTGFFSSCNKDDNNTGVTPQPSGPAMISALINGEYWSLSSGYAELQPTANMRINCSGSYGSINITVSPFNGVQTYALDGFTKIVYLEDNVQYNSIRGQIQITENAPGSVSGRFNCELISTTGSTSVVFTEGEFSVPKQ
ncbi:MAG: hypothetical protein EOP56_09845 [Sphingobacteriales bacterium]|nr:MAG: hypothetical protein EOP56_09845 [Sphingobacteriales bacterium]